MLARFKVPLTWNQIVRRTFDEAFFKDNCLGMAAQLSYYFFFALFPALLMLIAFASYFPYHQLVDGLFMALGDIAPPEALSIMTDQLKKISSGQQGGLLTLGFLTTLWSSSAAMTAIIDTLNAAYDIDEGRPWWKVRIVAVGLTMGGALFILVSFALVVAGPTMADKVADWFYLGPVFEWTWKILQWPFVFGLVSLAMAIVYYFAPDAEQDWVWLTPGSITAAVLWLGASLGFKFYVANFGNYTATYGAIGGVMVLMLWFYISGLVILLGAELNAEIEHASPYGKDRGEKVAGQRRKLGPAAMRAWLRHRRKHGEKPPSADEVKQAVGPTPADKAPETAAASGDDLSIAPERLAPPPDPVATPSAAAIVAPVSFSDCVIGAGVVAAQAFFALKVLADSRRGP
jgi:membrane protein